MASLQRRRAASASPQLGDDDPLYNRSLSKGPPDRRRLSLRWLAGSILTGVCSAVLVGGALQGAVGLNDYLIVRPALARTTDLGDSGALARKGDRFRPAPPSEATRRVIQISTVTRENDRDIVRVRPFAHVRFGLAMPVSAEIASRVPAFNALDIYSDGKEQPAEVASSDSIYGADVDGEVSIKVEDFPTGRLVYDESAELSESEAAEAVRQTAPFLAEGAVEVASLPYVDPARFDVASTDPTALPSLAVAITPENLSMIEKSDGDDAAGDEKVLTVAEGDALKKLLTAQGATAEAAEAIQSAFIANFSFDFRAGQTLRVGLAPDGSGGQRMVRVSLFDGPQHLATVALSDTGSYVAASPPAVAAAVSPQPDAAPRRIGALPSLFAGLWGSGLSYDMPGPLIESLIRVFAYDVDFQSRLSSSDGLEVIYSAEDGADSSDVLYAALTLGGATHRYYRFRSPDGGPVDYYDADGRSAKKFLVRKPVVEARFTSSFGMRYHPILHRYRLHSGIDWAAPVGTPILAAGNGQIEKIGMRSGYGRSITLAHANGYETTYNHMSGYARNLQAGMRVRQGQVIGFVGSSGLSTGPHLHFEVLVNGRFVDPMKIRLPRGRELQGADLAAFEQERQRIDDLITREDPRVASAASVN